MILFWFFSPTSDRNKKNLFHAWKDRELARSIREFTAEVWDGDEKELRWDDDDDYVDETENENEK